MATEGGDRGSNVEAPAPQSAMNATPSGNPQTARKPAAASQPASATATGEKKLSGAELKAKAKAEKAARRAASKVVGPPAPVAGTGGDAKGAKGKGKQQDAPQALVGKAQRQSTLPQAPKENKPSVPECFSHLSMAKRIPMTQADKDVHPAVLLLGQQMSSFVLRDSTKRLEATLLALKKVCLGASRWLL